jgi:DNA-binding transcriptional ArsR family regulator
MVVSFIEQREADEAWADLVFHALADRTRRDIVRRSMDGALSVSALARGYTMSFAAVQKHVAVLDRARLVTKSRHGREQLVRTDPDTLRSAQLLLEQFEVLWRARIDRFTNVLADNDNNDKGATP